MSEQLTGEVRVGVMPTFARAILATALTDFSAANPLVEIRVTEGYSALLTEMVLSGELDFAVVPDGAVPGGLRTTYLDTDLELLACGRPLDGIRGAVDLAAAPPLRLVLPGPGNARRAKIDRKLRGFPGVVRGVLEMDSMMTTLDIVSRGEWCSILPGCLCLPDLETGGLHLHPIVRPKMTVDYMLIEPAARASTPAAELLAEGLSEEIRRACETCRAHFRVA
jgi:DNA-binding transcriptional LysR family regulator